MSRSKFEEWFSKKYFVSNEHGSHIKEMCYVAWLAGRESMRDEAKNKIYLYAGEDMSNKQRICFSCVDIIRKIEL